LYCRSGNRSKKTVEIMRELGFKEINNLNGGYNELIQFTEEC
jgi:rhodanese-related sulfurtransferase